MSLLFQKMCRTCMLNELEPQELLTRNKVKMKAQMVSIFTEPEDSKERLCLIELLKTTLPMLKVEENDLLPKIVCLECSDKIRDIYQFQQNCLNVEQKFYKMMEPHDSYDPFDNNQDNEDILKTKLDDPFLEESSTDFDEYLLDDIKMEAATKKEQSTDLVDDDKSGSDWEEEQIRKTKKSKKSKKTNTDNSKLIDDKMFKIVCKDDENVESVSKPPSKKRSAKAKQNSCEKIYPCDKCKRKLKSELSFIKHQEMHDTEERTYECNICNKVFGKSSHLKDHSRTHIGEKPFLCSECGKGFTTAGVLKQHSFRHLSKKQFACPDCPRSFPTKPDLFSHSNIHKAMPKKNICDICGRGFKKPFLLKQHKMYHNNERPFECEFCKKCFFTNEKLKRHTRIHTGEKPFKCKYCEKAYCQSSELIKHLRCHLGDNVYQCEFCPLRFPSVKILREHFSTHKSDDEETRTRNLAELNAMETKGVFIK